MRNERKVWLTHATHWPLISDTFHPDPSSSSFFFFFLRHILAIFHARHAHTIRMHLSSEGYDGLLDTQLPYLDTYLQDPPWHHGRRRDMYLYRVAGARRSRTTLLRRQASRGLRLEPKGKGGTGRNRPTGLAGSSIHPLLLGLPLWHLLPLQSSRTPSCVGLCTCTAGWSKLSSIALPDMIATALHSARHR